MIKLGLTGGIGSGKSTVAGIFKCLGFPVFDSDTIAKSLYSTDKELELQIIQTFGPKAYVNDGILNKQFLIEEVFPDAIKLQKLNQLVHPRVKLSFEIWLSQHANCYAIVKEAAILFESGAYQQVDKIIVVTAPTETRINRVMQRDSISRDKVLERINKQWAQEKLIENADYIIDNSGLKSLILQVLDVTEAIKTGKF